MIILYKQIWRDPPAYHCFRQRQHQAAHRALNISCSRGNRGRPFRWLLQRVAPHQAMSIVQQPHQAVAASGHSTEHQPHEVVAASGRASSISFFRQWPHRQSRHRAAATSGSLSIMQQPHQALAAGLCTGSHPAAPHQTGTASGSRSHLLPVPYIRHQIGLGIHHLKHIRLMLWINANLGPQFTLQHTVAT
jgi:hypothetical protein